MPSTRPHQLPGMTRRALLQASLAASATLATWPLPHAPALWAAEAGQPKRGGILRVRGFDPPHFDPQLAGGSFRTPSTLSFIYTGVWRILNMAQIERKRISVYARGATPTRTSERVSPCSSSWYTIRPNCSLFSVAYTSV